MSFHGRSPDDLPLAAYTPGAPPDDEDELDPVPDPGYISIPAPSTPTADMQHAHAAAAEPDVDAPPAKRRGPGLSLRLPKLGRSKAGALKAAAPFQPVAGASSGGFQAVSGAVGGAVGGAVAPSAAFQATPALPVTRPFEPVTRPAGAARSGGAGVRALRVPKLSLRDPRVLAGGAVVVGLVLLVVSLLGGGPGSGAGGPNGSQDPNGALPTAAVLGNAEVELTSGLTGTFNLTGATGAGPAVDQHIEATWTDPLGQSLGLSGPASQGTRTTDENFVLTWTMLVNNVAVTFTSRDKECTIGMAVGVRAVSGSIHCKDLKSADGKHVIDFRGTYTT